MLARRRFESRFVLAAWRRNGCNVRRAARELGVSRTTPYNFAPIATAARRPSRAPAPEVRGLREARFLFLQRYLLRIMRRHRWNISSAARELRIYRTDLYKWLDRYGIRPRKRAQQLERRRRQWRAQVHDMRGFLGRPRPHV